MTEITLHAGDNRESLRRLIDQGVRVHSVVTDPPYGMTSVTKRFGAEKAAPAKFGTDGAFARASAGFMGSKWDGTGIERDPEFWALIYDILLPGGYVVAFSAARTGHWQACAMEMAGFVMHPFLGWVYGSGFPKAHNAAMAIDKALGVQSGFVAEGDPVKRMIPGADQNASGDWTKTDERQYQPGKRVPGSPEAAQWDGWAYGGQALKPALEPIYVGQKPFSEKNGALNILKHGVGAINIDGCRVPTTESWGATGELTGGGSVHDYGDGLNNSGRSGAHALGRHPANLLHDGSAEVVALFPESKGQQGDVRGTEPSHTGDDNTHCYGEYGRVPAAKRNDSGSAARFFNTFPHDICDRCGGEGVTYFGGSLSESPSLDCCPVCLGEAARSLDADPIRYQGKATKADRAGSRHPTVKPIALMQWLCRLITPPGGTVLDPFGGSGTTGAAAKAEGFDCILMEAEEQFCTDIRSRFNLPSPAASDDFGDLLAEPLDDFTCLIG